MTQTTTEIVRYKYSPFGIAGIMIGVAFILLVFSGLHFNPSPSEPIGLWRATHEPYARGAYVLLDEPLKQIAALNGDTVRTTPEGSYINGKLWPHSAPLRALHYPYGTYVLGPNEYWLMGQDKQGRSYDSRYLGFVTGNIFKTTVRPVWVEK